MEKDNEPTPDEVIRQQAENSKSIHLNLSDNFTNSIRVGDLIISSPSMTIKQLIKETKMLLKNKEIKNYLGELKDFKIKTRGSYLG